jgi:SPP1 family predicted phage head-tail adaptor
MIQAGQLSQRIAIQTATETVDGSGQPIRTWAALSGPALLPAKVDAVTGGETLRGRQVSAEATTLFTVRYRSDITTRMRVTYEGRTLGIVRVSDPYGDRRELRIECREVV